MINYTYWSLILELNTGGNVHTPRHQSATQNLT